MSIDLVSAIAGKALDGLFMRQMATAQNVANGGTRSFTPLRVSFEGALREAAQFGSMDAANTVAGRIRDVVPQVYVGMPTDGSSVQLDKEVTTASETSARYSMLIGLLDRKLQIEHLAVKGA